MQGCQSHDASSLAFVQLLKAAETFGVLSPEVAWT
jgi:hypothetical protein